MSQGGKGTKVSHASVSDSQGKERMVDRIGAFAGLSGRTVEKIASVCDAAIADPEKYQHLVERMDSTARSTPPTAS